MKFSRKTTTFIFVGKNKDIEIEDCGSIQLDNNDLITFLTKDNKEWDVVKKNWGFYATPSINDRLFNQGFRCALVKNKKGSLYIMLVEKNKINKFNNYILKEDNRVLMWLDEFK